MRLVFTLVMSVCIGAAIGIADPQRIVSLDGGTTETLFALGAGDQVVARGSGSVFPDEAAKLPKIGTGHQINVEAVLAFSPTLVVGRDRDLSGPGLHVLEQAKAHVVRLSDTPGPEAAKDRIRELGTLIGKPERAEELAAKIDADLAELAKRKDSIPDKAKPSVLIVYLRPGVAMLMGEDSNAAAMLKLAGATYALPGMRGYKDMNAEAVVAAKPDVILCYAGGLEAFGGADALWSRPGIRETPAGQNKRLIVMDDLLLAGFGPRTGEGAIQLFEALFPEQRDLAKAGR